MENVYLHRRALKPASRETTEITDRGRPVAMLMPHPDVGRLERVRLNGDLDPTTANLDDLSYPPRSTAPVAPTEVLTAMRSTER
jgi:antitoxin (DNA-binding transcriptional repressor) of toxin-antitoxin stability system